MNKQIDDMAKIIDDNHGFIVSSVETAKALYNAGYRKSTDVAREIFEEIDALCDKYPTIRTLGGKTFAELKKKYESEGAE